MFTITIPYQFGKAGHLAYGDLSSENEKAGPQRWEQQEESRQP